jgi:hypothetical protein
MIRRALFRRRQPAGAPIYQRRPEGSAIAPDLVVFIVAAVLAFASAIMAVILGIAER